jgi:outer membrane protein assembly factor BamB
MKSITLSSAIAALVLVVSAAVNTADAYTSLRVALTSNLLIRDGRVYFTQSDRGMTVLDLETGDVVMRRHDRDFNGRLYPHNLGIIINRWDDISLVDPDTLDTVWRSGSGYPSDLTETRFLFCVEDKIKCLDLDSGGVIWERDIPGRPILIARGQHVMVLRRDHPYSFDLLRIMLLDLNSGEMIFGLTAPQGECFAGAYFDGEYVYTLQGLPEEQDDPSLYKAASPEDCIAGKMTTYDLSGKLIEVTEDSPTGLDQYGYVNRTFVHAGRVFREDGHVEPLAAGHEVAPDNNVYVFPAATVSVKQVQGLDYDRSTVIAWRGDTTQWQGYLPHMDGHWSVEDIQSDGTLVVLGTDRGVVECMEAGSGQSLWLYTFPGYLGTMSYTSPNGMPPHATSLRAEFIRDNRPELKARPMIRLSDDFDLEAATIQTIRLLPPNTTSRHVQDPAPFDPYDWLPPLVRAVWGLFGLTMFLAIGPYALLRKNSRRYLTVAIYSAGLIWVPVGALYYLGRVSWPATLCLKILLLGLLAYSVIHVIRALVERRTMMRVVSGVLVGGMLLVAAYYALPVLRYA